MYIAIAPGRHHSPELSNSNKAREIVIKTTWFLTPKSQDYDVVSCFSRTMNCTPKTNCFSLSRPYRNHQTVTLILTPRWRWPPPIPTASFFLESNHDQLERVQARAARAAAIRRRNAAATQPSDPPDPFLEKEQIIELFQNCIKLARENVNNVLTFVSLWSYFDWNLFNNVCVCFFFFLGHDVDKNIRRTLGS